jgi:hypothetical protein
MFREICEVRELTEEEKAKREKAKEEKKALIEREMAKMSTEEFVKLLGLDMSIGEYMLERAEESGAALQAALRGRK